MTTSSENPKPKKGNPNQQGAPTKRPPTKDRGSNGGSIKPPEEYPPKKKEDKL